MDTSPPSTKLEGRSQRAGRRSHLVRRLALPLALSAAVGVAVFFGLTAGVQELSSAAPSGFGEEEGYLPALVHDPPRTVKTTDDYGPPGPVSMVFAGSSVETGLTGSLPSPWIAVSALTGDYRALVAPRLPAPTADAVAVAPDGRAVAWAYPGGVVLYDPLDDSARELQLGVGTALDVGRFSPDGRWLTVYGGGALYVLDTETGEVVGELDVPARPARQAIWTPDGEALTYVADGRLVTRPWRGGATQQTPTRIDDGSALAWHPSGERIAATDTAPTGTRVQLFDVAPDGSLEPAGTVAREAYSLQRMLGFGSETTVSGIGLGLETGPLPQLYRMSTQSPVSTDVAQLPAVDRVVRTVEFAAQPLQNGSAPFPEPDWPIRTLSKLVISVVTALFVLGMVLTRRPRGS